MAIIVEQDKKNSSGASAMLAGIIVVVIVIIGAYYLFFAPPPTVTVTPPANFAILEPIAQINFDPSSVLQSSGFQALKSYVQEPTSTTPGSIGRTDPFINP